MGAGDNRIVVNQTLQWMEDPFAVVGCTLAASNSLYDLSRLSLEIFHRKLSTTVLRSL
jgi:hypothetical protein